MRGIKNSPIGGVFNSLELGIMFIMNLIKQVYTEMSKVVWPSREKTLLYTLIVIIVSLFIAYYIGLFDFVFQTYGLKSILS